MKFVEKEERKQKGGCECRTKHKTRSARFFIFFLVLNPHS